MIEKARENMHRKHPKTRFVNAHMAMLYYDPAKVAKLLDTYPNADVEISATRAGSRPRAAAVARVHHQVPGPRADGIGRRPEPRRRRLLDAALALPRNLRRVLRASGADAHRGGSPGHGRWNISGIGLPDAVLRKVYYQNALRHLPALKASITRQLAGR